MKKELKPYHFQIGNEGREKTFKSPEELRLHIEEYFEERNSSGYIWTIEGLARSLGITRQTLLNYQTLSGYEAYFDIIKDAKERIHEQWMSKAFAGEGNPAMAIFLLKNNAGYVDRIEQHNTGDQNLSFEIKFK